MRLDPHLSFNGNCAEAFHFYQNVFGATDLFMMTWGQSPVSSQVPAEQHDQIMHAHMTIGIQHMMGADGGDRYRKPEGFRVGIEVNSIEDAEKFFSGLSESATIEMPLTETFWAIRFGMLTDRFGIPWMINHSKPMTAQPATA